MIYHTLFFRKLGKMSQTVLSAAVVIGALRADIIGGKTKYLLPHGKSNICEKVSHFLYIYYSFYYTLLNSVYLSNLYTY